MQTLIRDLFAKLFLMEHGVLKDGRMNGRGKPDDMNASQPRRL